ncbi:hypothetical protein [Treponema zioleckii]|uniref:hypothetical protein n=1 Tax=Treponema zioleckii TaxID=331680 RepID=UPI00168B6900|nr:hypothetical protein [Treponema zioleckii]
MTDVENLEKMIADVFWVEKKIKNKNNTNRCIQPLNLDNGQKISFFAYNFMNRLSRLNEKFKGSSEDIRNICEKVKNIGETHNSQWAGPYSELVALDFYTQFSEFFDVSYINILDIRQHKKSIPAKIGQKELIDIDLCLHLKNMDIFTDVKSFNCIHMNILDEIFKKVEKYALETLGKLILVGVDNLSSLDYMEVKNHLGYEKNKIFQALKIAVKENRRNVNYESKDGIKFNFKIEYSNMLSTVKDYSPFAMAEAYKYKFLDYGNKLIDNEYSVITIVKNPWFNEETVDFGDFNNLFYRSLSRRTFMELFKMDNFAREVSNFYSQSDLSVSDISKSLAGIVFIDDNSAYTKSRENLYDAYFYLNPNYANKEPLTIRKIEKFFHNSFLSQIKDFDDFKWDNY